MFLSTVWPTWDFTSRRKEVTAKTKTERLSEENQEPPLKKSRKRKRSSSHSKKHKHKRRRGKTQTASELWLWSCEIGRVSGSSLVYFLFLEMMPLRFLYCVWRFFKFFYIFFCFFADRSASSSSSEESKNSDKGNTHTHPHTLGYRPHFKVHTLHSLWSSPWRPAGHDLPVHSSYSALLSFSSFLHHNCFHVFLPFAESPPPPPPVLVLFVPKSVWEGEDTKQSFSVQRSCHWVQRALESINKHPRFLFSFFIAVPFMWSSCWRLILIRCWNPRISCRVWEKV